MIILPNLVGRLRFGFATLVVACSSFKATSNSNEPFSRAMPRPPFSLLVAREYSGSTENKKHELKKKWLYLEGHKNLHHPLYGFDVY